MTVTWKKFDTVNHLHIGTAWIHLRSLMHTPLSNSASLDPHTTCLAGLTFKSGLVVAMVSLQGLLRYSLAHLWCVNGGPEHL